MEEEHKDQLRDLQLQLNTAEEQVQSNKAAADILTDLIQKGQVE